MVKGILFELDVLLDVREAYPEACSALQENLPVKSHPPLLPSKSPTPSPPQPSQPQFDEIVARVRQLKRTDVSVHDWNRLYVNELLKATDTIVNEARLLELTSAFRTAFIHHIKLYPDARFILNLLNRLEIKVGVVADCSSEYLSKLLRELCIGHLIELSIVSEDCKTNTSSRVPWEKAAKELDLPPGEIVVIGDCISRCIAHANALGCTSVKIERTSANKPEAGASPPNYHDEPEIKINGQIRINEHDKPKYNIRSFEQMVTLVPWG